MRVHLSLSRYGMVFVPVLMAILLAAINYDNNLVYIILFLLCSLTVVSAVYTYRNMARIEIRPGHIWPTYAGGTLRFSLQVLNRASYPVYSVTFRHSELSAEFRVVCDSLEPGACQTVEFVEPAPHRGRYVIDKCEVASLFPLGLFRAYMTFPLKLEYIIYPRLGGKRPWPETEPDARTQDDGHFRGGENFYGLRNYQPGESQRHIDWKAVARGRPLMVKEFSGGGTGRLWFDWKVLSDLDLESRVSQLAAWVVQADQMGSAYGLRMPGQDFPPAIGPVQLQSCLTALAVYPTKERHRK